MRGKRVAYGWQILRRGVAAALSIIGIWLFSLTADMSQMAERVVAVGENPALVLAVFEGQLGGLDPMATDTLLSFSGLLQSGELAVTQHLSQTATEEIEPPTWEPIRAQGEDDGEQTPDISHPEYDDVFDYTAVGEDSSQFLWADPIYMANRTDKELSDKTLEKLLDNGGEVKLKQGAKILIIHSHGSEAYTPRGKDFYLESDPYRTIDSEKNIVRVGAEMVAVFEQAGFEVIHDTTLYDYPNYNRSYTNAREGVERWLEQHPDIDLVLDIHRDALTGADGTPYRLVSGEDSEVAQVMLVVGTNDSGLEHPDWEKNLDFAVQLQRQLVSDHGTMIRPITLRSSRFNQDLSPHFLLVEVGGHGNGLQDALAGAKRFAGSVAIALME